MQLSGGYLITKQPMIRARLNAHTTVLDRPVSELDLEAINAIQATPWAINRWVLDVMLEAWASGKRLGGLEVGEPLSLPKRLPDAVWAAMPVADRGSHRHRLAAIHTANASITGRSQAVLDCLTVASELRNEPAIYYPHSKDFRHRVYPVACRGPQPQGSDISKSLIHFANGLPLGPDGLFWLAVRAANCFGMDKLPLEERVAWTLGHRGSIIKAASTPLDDPWWTQADEPWSFLATCYELKQAWALPEPDEFVSHLPIPLDGSCNGLQHLSALGLDPVGAAATNLAAHQPRQDIYERVAGRVRELIEADVLAGNDDARCWHGGVTRKTVKRAVMTTPYGVTDRGIRDQLLNDGHVPDTDDGVGTGWAADYLRDKLVQALSDTVQGAKGIMAWLQVTADRLARAGLPFRWTTPTGSMVEQAYHVAAVQEVRTLCGKLTLLNAEVEAGLNVRKQALGSAPNFIHSFDAAHLSMTVLEANRRGMRSFSMIHDSYGVHARNTTELAGILREQFVAIYSQDWLTKLYDEVRAYAPRVVIDKPPQRGTFNIQEVTDAEFFFS